MPPPAPGPISHEPDCFGQTVPFYALTFDKRGTCTSPQSLDHLIAALAPGGASDLIVFSHGWNNDYATALDRYRDFLRGVSDAAEAHPGLLPADFKPIFVGIYWPSAALTWPWEQAPDFAAEAPEDDDEAPENDGEDDAAELRDLLDPPERAAFDALVAGRDEIGSDGAEELARLIAPKLLQLDDAGDVPGRFTADDLLEVWRNAPVIAADGGGAGDMDAGGFDDFGDGGGADAGPEVAGLNLFPVRKLLRLTTVLTMKDRAGVVGRGDVAAMLRRVLDDTPARLHLVGHSYGTKVILSALVAADAARPAETALLLQPAISHLCFAGDLGDGRPGGFREALARVVRPIHSTFSSNDFPLYQVFHLAARRRADIGEVQILGAPSRYAALGGYGPSGLRPGEGATWSLPAPGQGYGALDKEVRLLALNGATGIEGHSDVTNGYTFWAMLNLLKRG